MSSPSRHRWALAGLIALLGSASAAEADLPPAWQCLPEEAVFLVRVPDPMQSVDELRERTQFGRLLFSEDRWAKVVDWLRDEEAEMWEEMTEDLGRVGLTPEDLPQYLTGSFGYAVVMEPRPGRDQPLALGLAWLEPGDDLAEKGLDAIASMVEHQDPDAEIPTRRVDLDIAGHRVMHLSTPYMRYHFDSSDLDFDEELPPPPSDVFVDPQHDAASPREDAAGIVQEPEAVPHDWEDRLERRHVDQNNIFLTRIGDRILIAHTFPNNAARFSELARGEDDPRIDFDELSGVDEAIGTFGRFLHAHEGGGEDYGARILATPGMDAALPGGRPMVELFGDFRPAWNLIRNDDDPTAWGWLQRLGLDDLSTGGMRLTLDGQVLRHGLFLAAPEPRRGLVELLDQRELDPTPPNWVPEQVIDYTHVSFDLGGAYAYIRGLVEGEVGEPARQGFEQADVQAQAIAQADVQTILEAFGHQHMLVSYLPRLAEGGDAEVVNPMAFVWRLADEPVIERLVQAAGMGQMFFGPLFAQAEEQGFTGWRLDAPEFPMALMAGRGFLTLAIGEGVTEQVLSVLRNPPDADAALAGSERMRRLNEVFEPRPGIAFDITDMGRYADSLVSIFLRGFEEEMRFHADDAEVAAELERIRDILPTEEEVRGMFDVSGSHVFINGHGLVGEGALILPSP